MPMNICTYTRGDQKSTWGACPNPFSFHSFTFETVSRWTRSPLTDYTGCLANLGKLLFPPLQSWDYRRVLPHSTLRVCMGGSGTGHTNLGPHACVVTTLRTEPSCIVFTEIHKFLNRKYIVPQTKTMLNFHMLDVHIFTRGHIWRVFF